MHDFLCLLVVKRELETEAATLAEKEKASTAEVCIGLICLVKSNGTIEIVFGSQRPVACLTILVNDGSFQGSKVPVNDPICLSVSGVYFTCPLTGATLTKSEREAHIKEAIFMVRLKAYFCCLSSKWNVLT